MAAVSEVHSASAGGPRPLPAPAVQKAAGVFLGFCLAGILNGALLLRAKAPTLGLRTAVLAVDAASFLLVGALASLVVWRLAGSRLQRFGLLLLALVSVGLGVLTLHDDLEHFSQGFAERVPPDLILASGTLLISLAVPAAAFVANRLAVLRWGRWVVLAAAVAVLLANALVLPADYFGIHLYLCAVGTTLAATALARAAVPVPRRFFTRSARTQWFVLALFFAVILAPLAAPLPAPVKLVLSRSESSSYYRLVSRVRAQALRGRAGKSRKTGDWFKPRAALPPIPASRPALVPADAVIVFVSVDALRADVVNSGERDAAQPNFARVRSESVWFSQARAAATLTKLSLSALFMSKYFSQQYWTAAPGGGAHAPRRDTSPRFVELLSKAGVRTLNFQSIGWLHNGNGTVRGFDEEKYVPYPKAKNYYTPAPPVFDEMLPALASIGPKPALIFTHLSDPHAPYNLGKRRGSSSFDRYLAEVEFVDLQLGRLLAVLDEPALRERAVLILSADHGEAFDEHNSRTHGTTLYDETLRVPLMVRLPRRRGREVATRVGLIDVGPTILDLMGIDTPGAWMGQSLVGFLRGQTPELTRPLLAETRHMQSLITPGGLKVIVDNRQDRTELYDLVNDPRELENMADSAELLAEPLANLRELFEVHRLRREGYEPPFVR